MNKILPANEWVPYHLNLIDTKIEAVRLLRGPQRTLELVDAAKIWGGCGTEWMKFSQDFAQRVKRGEIPGKTPSDQLACLGQMLASHKQFIPGYANRGQLLCEELRAECNRFQPPEDAKPTLVAQDGLLLMERDMLNPPGAPYVEGKIDLSYFFHDGLTPTAALTGLAEKLKVRAERELKQKDGQGAASGSEWKLSFFGITVRIAIVLILLSIGWWLFGGDWKSVRDNLYAAAICGTFMMLAPFGDRIYKFIWRCFST